MLSQRSRQMVAALEDAERLQPFRRCKLKRFAVEVRMHERDVVRQTLDGFAVEEVAEELPF